MTTIEDETPTRRVRVTHEPLPGVKPWRAVIVTPPGDTLGDVAVGRFDSQHEAITTGVSALRFVDAGIAWHPVGEPEVER